MRVRITFAKNGALRYIGHLDLHSLWERAARRAALPLAYSQGFHPQPKLQLAAALPLGFSSRCEVADLRLETEIEISGLAARLTRALPEGIQILGVEEVNERAAPLQTRVDFAEYEATLPPEVDESALRLRLDSVLRAEALPRERRGKPYDLKPLIAALELLRRENLILFMRLAAREGATGRPEEVLDALGISFEIAQIERTRLIFKPETLQ
ncbi:MAG: TIGR03936 family radical SAM-associated protein [Anaerolineales bacterium]